MSALLTELLSKRRRLDERIRAEVARIEAGDITADAVVVATAQILDVPIRVVLSETRTSRIVKARWVAAKVLRDGLALSLPQIGNALGNRDHTTILHGLREIEKHKDLCVKADSIRNNLWSATR